MMTKQGLVTHQVGEANFGHLNICLWQGHTVTPSLQPTQPASQGEKVWALAQPWPGQTSLYVEQLRSSLSLSLRQ